MVVQPFAPALVAVEIVLSEELVVEAAVAASFEEQNFVHFVRPFVLAPEVVASFEEQNFVVRPFVLASEVAASFEEQDFVRPFVLASEVAEKYLVAA